MKSLSASISSQLYSWQLECQTSAPAPKEKRYTWQEQLPLQGEESQPLVWKQMANVLKYTDSQTVGKQMKIPDIENHLIISRCNSLRGGE